MSPPGTSLTIGRYGPCQNEIIGEFLPCITHLQAISGGQLYDPFGNRWIRQQVLDVARVIDPFSCRIMAPEGFPRAVSGQADVREELPLLVVVPAPQQGNAGRADFALLH